MTTYQNIDEEKQNGELVPSENKGTAFFLDNHQKSAAALSAAQEQTDNHRLASGRQHTGGLPSETALSPESSEVACRPRFGGSLTWLHLSDWHQKGADFDRKVVRDALLADLRNRAQVDPGLATVDFVIFSGDLAWQGKAEEYQAAGKELFDGVLDAVGLPPDKLFIVPGNHDLSRSYVQKMLPPDLQQPFQRDEQVHEWLTDEDMRQRVLEPFKHFSEFVMGFTGQDPAAYANTSVQFFGDVRVGILCLNSAWMSGRNKDVKGEVNDYGFLLLGEPQIHDALAKIQDADVRIAVMHHPFSWLAEFDRNRVEESLKKACHFVLHGHEHQPKFSLAHELSGECGIVPAGACYERRTASNPRYTNAYNFVRLNFDSGEGEVFLRMWSDRRKEWMADHEAHPGGRYSFRLPKELGASRKQPTKPVAVVVPSSAKEDTPAVKAYLRRLEEDTSKLKLIGLGKGVSIELPIEQAYIPLQVAVSWNLRQQQHGRFDEKHFEERGQTEESMQLGDLFKWAKRFGTRGVLLLGDPGAGKTTGARQFCWRMLKEPNLRQALGLPDGAIPVLLRLRNLKPQQLAQGIRAFVTETLLASSLPTELANPGPDLLVRTPVLWVFDGLDEVVSEEARVQVCGWLASMLEERPSDIFLVTSRYSGYQGRVELGAGFSHFHVKPLSETQVAEFVERWYRTVYQRLRGPEAKFEETAQAEVESLMGMLQQPEYRIGRLRELPVNPLMLTILCVVHHEDRNLPRKRADLYGKCVRVLLEHWRKDVRDRQGLGPFDPVAAEAVLGTVAWWMHGQEGRITAALPELGKVAEKALADVGGSAGLGRDGEKFIERMRDESGILAMWGAGQCGYLHLTFQEFLAGLHAAKESRAEELAEQFGKSWWREATLLALAIGSKDYAQTFFTAVLKTDAVMTEGGLIDQCLEEALYPALEPFLAAMQEERQTTQRQLEILRRLRQASHPQLLEVCRRLVETRQGELAELAREILLRSGIVTKSPKIEGVSIGLVMHRGMAFMRIPAGEFDMGSKRGDSDERPIHRVQISKPFLLGKYPVTNAEYQRFLLANPKASQPAYWYDHQFNDPRQPVVGVSWKDAQAFCVWSGCRLPTEAEWEYACRAGTSGETWVGDLDGGSAETLLDPISWYAGNSDGRTHPVGSKAGNPWGLHDMLGNVLEWCQDVYGRYSAAMQVDPAGPTRGGHAVFRGGAWSSSARHVRAAYRNGRSVSIRHVDLGFRLARDLETE
jgi:formylglycine-generating enzyme required for sulfatase activity/predicted phosphodiesterase